LSLEQDAAGGDFFLALRARQVTTARSSASLPVLPPVEESFAAASCGAEFRAGRAGEPDRLFPEPPLESATWCAAESAVVSRAALSALA
jgi:hypothetical protein